MEQQLVSIVIPTRDSSKTGLKGHTQIYRSVPMEVRPLSKWFIYMIPMAEQNQGLDHIVLTVANEDV
jgi:hypothetical protein